MNLYNLLAKIDDNSEKNLQWFLDFAKEYLEFVQFGEEQKPNIQAEIISQNEPNYRFFQYTQDAGYCVTRPINSDIFISLKDFDKAERDFKDCLKNLKDIVNENELRENINKVIYTCQQSVGCALDATNNSNKAKKKNGNLFEFLIKDTIKSCGIDIDDKDETVKLQGSEGTMKFEHDVILLDSMKKERAIGQLKTSSKDRLDKIFLDKYMYNKIKELDMPHFAIFLNDVQRKENKKGNVKYGINSTFLPGHFKAYTIALNPLDGVYYLDLRPSISSDSFLKDRIFKLDKFLVEDMWKFIE